MLMVLGMSQVRFNNGELSSDLEITQSWGEPQHVIGFHRVETHTCTRTGACGPKWEEDIGHDLGHWPKQHRHRQSNRQNTQVEVKKKKLAPAAPSRLFNAAARVAGPAGYQGPGPFQKEAGADMPTRRLEKSVPTDFS